MEHSAIAIICIVVSTYGDSDHKAFGSWLRAGRLTAGLSQEELAGRSGVSVRAISDLERGRTRWPHPDSVGRLADALELEGARRAEFVALAARRLATSTVPPGVGVSAGELDGYGLGAGGGGPAAAAAAGDGAAACGLYAEALELWRGEPAADAGVPREHPAVAGLARRRAEAVLGYADAASGLDWHARVIPLLEALAREQRLDERVHARLIVALAGTGQQTAAIQVHEELRRRLDAELGVRPGPELTAAYERVRCQARPPAVAGSTTAANGTGTRTGPPSAPLVRYSLLPDTAAFTGRQAELDRITAAVTGTAGTGGVGAIVAISGMPGVGKTALAVRAAHLLKERFPDRQLFLSLHAHTSGQHPVTPEAALAGLLTAVGVDARYLPGDLEGRTALWRDRMAGEQALLVLDNAASSAQVTPLLPGGEGCLVLVTSRRHLGDLPGAAAPVLLEALPPPEAREMFTRLAPRAADGPPETVAELAGLAGFLPLAISLLARVCAWHPSWTLADLAAETRARMLTLAAENDSVAAAFEVSYRHLDPVRQEFFRRLALHPGSIIDGYAAAALAESSLEEADGQLDALHGEGLLAEVGRRRYGMHDLIRRYARDLAATDPAAIREQALDRLLDYYQHTAARAGTMLARQARDTSPARCLQVSGAAAPGLVGSAQALAWVQAERGSLFACLDHATAAGWHARVVALTAAMASLLRHDGPWTTAITRHATAVTAARHLGDQLGQASALTDLGDVRRRAGDYSGAAQALEEALGIFRDSGHELGRADALTDLGDVRRMTGDYPGAAQALEEALGIFRDSGHELGQVDALISQGILRRHTGDYPGAAQALEEALGIFRDSGHVLVRADALIALGVVRRETGDYRGAAQALEEALGISCDVGSRLVRAGALLSLGKVRRLTGDLRGAAQALEEALGIFRDAGNRRGQAGALTPLGVTRRETGDYRGAAQALEDGLAISRDIGDRGAEVEALNEIGTLHRARGDFGQAAQYHRQALALAREIASPWDEAHALAGLGRYALARGRTADAIAGLCQARDVFQRIGASEAAGLATELDSIPGT
jgi:tetratricopeptide (TPR) repeat protein